jgi:hypothetical protein
VLFLFPFVGKFANHADTVAERGKNGAAPAARHERSGLLVHGLVGFGVEAQTLAGGRSGELLHGDGEGDVAAGLLLDVAW